MLLPALSAFLFGYLINMFYITVLYHRGLTHGAVVLRPWMRRWVAATGSWVTGMDPKSWSCMHRLHHEHSDTEHDPHSPHNLGVFGVLIGQARAYEGVVSGLVRGDERLTAVVRDLDFPVHWVHRKNVWWLPYLTHFAIAIALGLALSSWIVGAAYWFGMLSHPIQGFLVNSFAHRYGYRNHDSPDHSTNNTLVAWFVFGEGLQNNHHTRPYSAKFSEKWFEFDPGYAMVRLAALCGLLKIQKAPHNG